MRAAAKLQYRRARDELRAARKKEDASKAVLRVLQRSVKKEAKQGFGENDPYGVHPFQSAEDAEAQLECARKDVAQEGKKVQELEESLPPLKLAANCGWSKLVTMVENGLLQQEAARAKEEVYVAGRWKALEKGWRRPWDGRDGADFAKWKLTKDIVNEGNDTPASDSWSQESNREIEFHFDFLQPELRRAGIAAGQLA